MKRPPPAVRNRGVEQEDPRPILTHDDWVVEFPEIRADIRRAADRQIRLTIAFSAVWITALVVTVRLIT